MCTILKEVCLSEYTGYKVLAKKDGEYYSIFTGQKVSLGQVQPHPECFNPLTLNWNGVLFDDVKFSSVAFYDPNYVGNTAVFVNYNTVLRFFNHQCTTVEEGYELALVRITLTNINLMGEFYEDFTLAGSYIVSIDERFDPSEFTNWTKRISAPWITSLKGNLCIWF